MNTIDQMDRLNFCVARLTSYFDDQVLGHATGFFYGGMTGDIRIQFLLSNWHVFSGRHADNHSALDSKGRIPNQLRASLVLLNHPDGTESQIASQEVTISLYDADGNAQWLQHPTGSRIDIAAISLGPAADTYRVYGIGEEANEHDIAIEIGNDVFILGYPLGQSNFLAMPIWKRGVIASEPHLQPDNTPPRIFIDATTRNGMSGAPVIMRAKTHYLTEGGEIKQHANASRFVGVYASRPGVDDVAASLRTDSRERAEIGVVFKSGAAIEVLQGEIRGPRYGELPEKMNDG